MPKLLTGRDLAGFEERRDSYLDLGVSADLADRVAAMVPTYSAFDIVQIAASAGRPIEETAEVYFDLADRLQITRLRDRTAAIRRILSKIGTLEIGARDAAFAQLLILSGLRKLGESVRTEVQAMPIMHDILDHEIIGPAIKQGIQEGIQQGRQLGLEQGLQQGMQQEGLSILRRLIEKRFGPLPASAEDHLTRLSVAELEDLSLRVLDAKGMDDLFDR